LAPPLISNPSNHSKVNARVFTQPGPKAALLAGIEGLRHCPDYLNQLAEVSPTTQAVWTNCRDEQIKGSR
ncbi:hypothetical protein OH710_25890, partial [Pseudomonas capsici]|uniref:hypothetical protein n=1 Tax=Pseudomonas capsici TaxID=2810614 RepID=UPI0021F0D18C